MSSSSRRRVTLVHDQQLRCRDLAQTFGNVPIERDQSRLSVHDKQDQIRGFNRDLDLMLNVACQIIHVGEPHSARVHQLKVSIRLVHQVGDPITGHSRGGVDDGHSPSSQPIEERTLADVGTTDNDHTRNRHERLNWGVDKPHTV